MHCLVYKIEAIDVPWLKIYPANKLMSNSKVYLGTHGNLGGIEQETFVYSTENYNHKMIEAMASMKYIKKIRKEQIRRHKEHIKMNKMKHRFFNYDNFKNEVCSFLYEKSLEKKENAVREKFKSRLPDFIQAAHKKLKDDVILTINGPIDDHEDFINAAMGLTCYMILESVYVSNYHTPVQLVYKDLIENYRELSVYKNRLGNTLSLIAQQ